MTLAIQANLSECYPDFRSTNVIYLHELGYFAPCEATILKVLKAFHTSNRKHINSGSESCESWWRLASHKIKTRGRILVQVTIYRRLLIGRDGHLDQSEAYDIS